MALVSSFLEILRRPTIGAVILELVEFMAPIWIAVAAGILVGWAWRPKWACPNLDIPDSIANEESLSPSKSVGAFKQFYASMPRLNTFSFISSISSTVLGKEEPPLPSVSVPDSSLEKVEEDEKSGIVDWDDFRYLRRLVEGKDGGPAWIQMMDKSTENMSYQAWRRDPETGPPQYCSRTVYEDVTPDMLRDFFWDDEFRTKWDDMLIQSETLDHCPLTGTMLVRWTRKFPFFCSDREYIIARRIWNSGQTFYCVTKGVPCSSVPRQSKPRRVDLYYSSWCIHAAESRRDGRMSACEVLLFHHEEMGIPREIAKLGVRQGMWGAVKKIDPGLRAYQKHRASGEPLSHSAIMAKINTKVCTKPAEFLENSTSSLSAAEPNRCAAEKDLRNRPIAKMLVAGSVIALVCSLDRGLLTKAIIFGVGRRFANMGKRL